MTDQKASVARNSKTGSYTVRLQKSARTGKFVSESKSRGSIVLPQQGKRAS